MEDLKNEQQTNYSKFWILVCKIISYVFHPLFIPTYIFLFLMWQFPYEFAGIGAWQLKLKLFSTFWLTAFFQPLLFFYYGD